MKQQTERSAPGACSLHLASNVAAVAMRLRSLKEAGGSLLVMTGDTATAAAPRPLTRRSACVTASELLYTRDMAHMAGVGQEVPCASCL